MRDFDNFINILDKVVSTEVFASAAKKALFSAETTTDEISIILLRYEVRDLFDFNLLKDLIDNLSIQHRILALVDSIVSLVSDIFEQIQDSIIGLIIDLVISDYGDKRLLGRKLFDTVKPSIENVSILTLDENCQIKFVVSLTQDYNNPEHRSRHICHIFNSNSSEVRAFLIKVIIDYTLNYFGLFKTIIEEGSFKESNELNQYKELLNAFNDRFNLSHHCIELNSENFFPDVFEIAHRSEQEFIQEQIRKYETSQQHSMLKYFKPLTLGRGGGFRRDGKVTPLAKISSSTLVPMMIASKTPLEQRQFSNMLLKNWTLSNNDDE